MPEVTPMATITAHLPASLRDEVAELARANYGSQAAVVRRALAEHVERERAHAGTPAVQSGAVEAGAAARSEGAGL
jgi:predicted transcriptional regulator